jgi:hypothetical protein
MNEFDLRSYLYSNPLLESEKKLKAKKKELEKQEDKLDSIDMKDEDAKEKAAHHKGAIKNVKKEIKDLEKDLKFDEKAEAKEKKEEKKKKKSVKEGMGKSYSEDGEMKEEMEDKKLTKEGLKSMIREKITSILNEENIDESDASTYRGDSYNKRGVGVAAQPKSTSTADRQAYIDSLKEDEEIEEQEDVEVRDEENVDVDIEKDVEVDDVSKETDIDVKTSLPGESEDVDAVLGLLTKAKEESERFAGEDEELGTQIGNVITYFTRKHVAK